MSPSRVFYRENKIMEIVLSAVVKGCRNYWSGKTTVFLFAQRENIVIIVHSFKSFMMLDMRKVRKTIHKTANFPEIVKEFLMSQSFDILLPHVET